MIIIIIPGFLFLEISHSMWLWLIKLLRIILPFSGSKWVFRFLFLVETLSSYYVSTLILYVSWVFLFFFYSTYKNVYDFLYIISNHCPLNESQLFYYHSKNNVSLRTDNDSLGKSVVCIWLTFLKSKFL